MIQKCVTLCVSKIYIKKDRAYFIEFEFLSVRHQIQKIAYFKAFYQNLNPLADHSREFLYVAADVGHPEAQTAKAKFCRL